MRLNLLDGQDQGHILHPVAETNLFGYGMSMKKKMNSVVPLYCKLILRYV